MQIPKGKNVTKFIVLSISVLLSGCGKQPQEVEGAAVIPEKQLVAQMGTIKTSNYNEGKYCDPYIVGTQEELELFLYYMDDYELEESPMFSDLDFSTETLLIIPIEESTSSVEYICNEVILVGDKLKLNYTIEGDEGPVDCAMARYYPYAILPNSELSEEYYDGWMKPSDVIEGEIPAELGTITTREYSESWEYENCYIIQSDEELKLFFQGMNDKKLKKDEAFSLINFQYMTLLIAPIQVKSNDDLCECKTLVFKDGQLTLQYSLEGAGKTNEGARFYPYAVVLNGNLDYDTYDGWVKPSDVFGK